jgi:hypothetical protein
LEKPHLPQAERQPSHHPTTIICPAIRSSALRAYNLILT